MLQALGSKAEERAKRRKRKKDSYARYLESSTWKKIRARVLKRDKHTCRACGTPAQVVHHIRYPKNLGEERLEWLYALCVLCHDEIHRRASVKGCSLRRATREVLNLPPPHPTPKKPKKATARPVTRIKLRPAIHPPKVNKRDTLAAENDRLHEIQRRNRERRTR